MKHMLRVLIADDEKPARDKLRHFLEASDVVSTIYEAIDGAKALAIVRTEHPDVVFLDIGMPGLNGITTAEAIAGEGGPYIVFVTAYDEHAIRAFELGAIDYLLKPFDRDRFTATMKRVATVAVSEHVAADLESLKRTLRMVTTTPAPVERLKVDDDDGSKLVSVNKIIRFDADRNYVRVFTTEGKFRLRTTVGALEQRLPGNTFARVNRSQIVNLDMIQNFTPAGHGDLDVRMIDGSIVRLSRRYRHHVQRLIEPA